MANRPLALVTGASAGIGLAFAGEVVCVPALAQGTVLAAARKPTIASRYA